MARLDDRLTWQRVYGKMLSRLRFRTAWRRYVMYGSITYGEYKQRCFEIVNAVREAVHNPPYSWKKFDEGWQYRQLCADKYGDAYNEMLNLIFGWW